MRAHRLTRREFLSAAGALPVAAALPRLGHAAARPITVSHSISTFVYAQHLVAREKRFFDEEGVSADQGFIVPGGGARVVQAVAAGQAMFALGDSNHPLKISEKGKEAVILFATDTRCSYANIVARRELYDAGLTSIDQLATMKRADGGKWVIAATAIGSGTWVYGSHVLAQQKAPGGKSAERLRGVGRRRRFDDHARGAQGREVRRDHGGAGMDVGRRGPGVRQGDLRRPRRAGVEPRLRRAAPVTVGYCLRETIERQPAAVQGYVSACYRAQKWIEKAAEGEILELLHKPYMDTFSRDEVLKSIRYYKGILDWDFLVDERQYQEVQKIFLATKVLDGPIPFQKAVDMSFVRKASQRS